jgi:hypothetical protein
MGVRAAQDFQMKKAGEAVIVVIGRCAGHMPEHVLPLGWLADFH